MLTRYVPNPIDLWHSRSPTSLLLLPFVFAIYVVLQIPLHYGSDTEDETWRGRAKDVDKLSADLKVVEHDMHEVKEDQLEIKGEVASLRRRLNKMKQRREERAQGRFFREEERRREEAEIKELWKKQEQLQEAREREREYQLQQEQQGGASGKEGPIASVAMVKAMAVATFAGGQQANVDDAKKAD